MAHERRGGVARRRDRGVAVASEQLLVGRRCGCGEPVLDDAVLHWFVWLYAAKKVVVHAELLTDAGSTRPNVDRLVGVHTWSRSGC